MARLVISALVLCFGGRVATAHAQQGEWPAECAAGAAADTDGDGLADACEDALAAAFAPVLRVRAAGCNWDAAAGRLHGGYFHVVQPVDSVIRIAYMPAYFRDCGWSGLKCWLPWVDCSAHAGDSEIIIVELGRAAQVMGVFLSAHCFARSTSSCRWYRGSDIEAFEWHGGAPVVWVAEGRQANYPSARACDRGHHSVDSCDNHDGSFVFPVAAERNVGSRSRPRAAGGCVTGTELQDAAAEADAVECFWRADARFRGWQQRGRGVTPYYRYLVDIAGF